MFSLTGRQQRVLKPDKKMLYEKMQAYFKSVNLKHISVQIVVHLYVVFVVNGKINIRIILADIEVFSWIRIRDSTKTLKNYLAAFFCQQKDQLYLVLVIVECSEEIVNRKPKDTVIFTNTYGIFNYSYIADF